jgi:hypothetical protein
MGDFGYIWLEIMAMAACNNTWPGQVSVVEIRNNLETWRWRLNPLDNKSSN